MARRRKSKKNVVQVTPDATLNYISGILTGANSYISGLLEGANEYNSWVQQEMALEGTEIGAYKKDSLREYLEGFKKLNPGDYQRFISDPYAYMESLKASGQYDNFLTHLMTTTNYGRLKKTDEAMIKAGQNYREQIPSLIKSRNVDTGLTFLQNYAPNAVKSVDKINGIMRSSIKIGE